MTKAVYIGAGLDILPVLLNDNIKEFIYIDSQPTSEFGMLGFTDKKFFRKNFLETLNTIMHNNNFKLKTNENNCLKYYNDNTNQTINYHINTPFPENLNNELITKINDCDVLICIGHDPDKKILEYIKKPFTFIGSTHTCYQSNKENYETPLNSTFLELYENNLKVIKYNLIAEKTYYEYWKHEKINKNLLNNFNIKYYESLKDLENERKYIYTEFYD